MKGLKFPASLPEHVTEALASLDGGRLELRRFCGQISV